MNKSRRQLSLLTFVISFSTAAVCSAGVCDFIRGDANGDGRVDIADVVTINSYLSDTNITSTNHTVKIIAADVDNDNDMDAADASYLLNYLFYGGPAPRPPFPVAGPDPDCPVFIRGDANGDGRVNDLDTQWIADAVFGEAVICVFGAGDANHDGYINLADAAYLISYLHRGGPSPAPPFPRAGCDQ